MTYTPLLRRVLNKPPLPYTGRSSFSSGMMTSGSSTTAQMAAMGTNSTLFAIVSNLANATAAVDWKLYRKSTTGNPDDRQEVTSHPALVVWNKPNNFYTRQEFVESVQQHIDLTGEGWWVVDRIGGKPIELWPVRPDRITPVPNVENYISGYIYKGPEGERIPLDVTDVVQIRLPNPMDPYRGAGPVQSLLMWTDSARYSAEWNRNFFANSAEPGGVIEAPESITDDELKRLQSQWRAGHQGVTNVARVAFLENGMKWNSNQTTQKDMQFVELNSVSREIIQEAFGFPKSMLGTVSDVNRASAEAMEYLFTKWRIVPRLERIKGALNNDFLAMFGESGKGIEFDYCNPVPENGEQEIAERNSMVDAIVKLSYAGFDSDEVCIAMGISPIKRNVDVVGGNQNRGPDTTP